MNLLARFKNGLTRTRDLTLGRIVTLFGGERLDERALEELEEALLEGPATWGFSTHLWTLKRIAFVIWKTCHVRYHPHHVWRILKSLGWSRQRPTKKAKERNEEAIAHWVKVRWPQVKKTLEN